MKVGRHTIAGMKRILDKRKIHYTITPPPSSEDEWVVRIGEKEWSGSLGKALRMAVTECKAPA